MTFVALLTKELRLRLRRERTIWVLISYLLVMTLLGFLFISRNNPSNGYTVSTLGYGLYTLLVFVQLSLIMFITPAFTTTSINGEKERHTFDLLLCSRLSAFELVAGKLVAGLANAFLLIAASIPLFSLVFFFGGVGPAQVLQTTLVFIVTAIVVGTFGLFCSTLLKRPPVSTAIAYMFCIMWVITPWLLSFLLQLNVPFNNNAQATLIFIGSPILAMISTFTLGPGSPLGSYSFYGTSLAPWITFIIINLLLTIVLLLLSVWLVKPNPIGRLSRLMEKRRQKDKVVATT
ncbi:MAG: ABC transporter permease [Chloroflexi bacterium]|nr:MAG: ABC transporter permease [Chloroflexota bacterium]